jgi:hypothetical protein
VSREDHAVLVDNGRIDEPDIADDLRQLSALLPVVRARV